MEAGHRPGSAGASWSPACKCSWLSPRATAWWTETSSAARPRPERVWQEEGQPSYLFDFYEVNMQSKVKLNDIPVIQRKHVQSELPEELGKNMINVTPRVSLQTAPSRPDCFVSSFTRRQWYQNGKSGSKSATESSRLSGIRALWWGCTAGYWAALISWGRGHDVCSVNNKSEYKW